MTNEIKTEVGNIVDSAAGAVKQLVTTMDQWPISVLIVAVLIVIIIVLRTSDFPNRRVLLTIVLLGSAMNGIMGSPKTIPSDQAYPIMVLAFKGMLLGFISAAIHSLLIKRFEKKFPFLNGKTGDTIEIRKSDTNKKDGGIKFDE